MGRVTIRKGQGIVYQGLGWQKCTCGKLGFHYIYRGRHEVKHHTQVNEAQQLTFASLDFSKGLQLLQPRRQKTCYIPKKRRGRA